MQLHLSIKTSLIYRLINFWNLLCIFCECHDKEENLFSPALLELTYLTLKKEKYFFHQISDQPPAKRTTLLMFVGTYLYVDEI